MAGPLVIFIARAGNQILFGETTGGNAPEVTVRAVPPDPGKPTGYSPEVILLLDQPTAHDALGSVARSGGLNAGPSGVALDLVPLGKSRTGTFPLLVKHGKVYLDLRLRNLLGADDGGNEASDASLIRFKARLSVNPQKAGGNALDIWLNDLVVGESRPRTIKVQDLTGNAHGRILSLGAPSAVLRARGIDGPGWELGEVAVNFCKGVSSDPSPVRVACIERLVHRTGPPAWLSAFSLRAEPGDWLRFRQRPTWDWVRESAFPRLGLPGRPIKGPRANSVDWVVEMTYGEPPNPEHVANCSVENARILEAWRLSVSQKLHDALFITSPGSAISFIPEFEPLEKSFDCKPKWVVLGVVTDKTSPRSAALTRDALVIGPPTIQRLANADPFDVVMTFPGIVLHDMTHLVVRASIMSRRYSDTKNGDDGYAPEMEADEAGRFTFDVVIDGISNTSDESADVRIGSLDFTPGRLSEFSDGRLKRAKGSPTDSYRSQFDAVQDLANPQEASIVHSLVVLPLHAVVPGAQDPVPRASSAGRDFDTPLLGKDEVAEQHIRDRFDRDQPIVLARKRRRLGSDAPLGHGFMLRARDNVDRVSGRTRTLSLNLFRDPTAPAVRNTDASPRTGGDLGLRVIVLDRHPLLAAEVRTSGLGGIEGPDPDLLEIGSWSSDAVEAPAWQLRGSPDGFDLALPAQGLGEELERGKDIGAFPECESVPGIDWRLSAPARFSLLSSYNPRRFPEAAWNLRRVLGYPGQRAPGAGVLRLQFELLYGMICDVQPSLKPTPIRLAELSSRIGSPPGPLPREAAWGPGRSDHPLTNAYAAYRQAWSYLFQAYQSRLGILQPYSDFQPQGLLLESDVTFRLRRGADLAYPVKGGAHPAQSLAPRGTLKGGLSWGLESAAAYEELWSDPVSVAGKLMNPAFSALGGWGYQRASFSQGKQIIHSNTSMGRVFYFSLERVGRVGCLWNNAKHVIIYERTVVPSEQFAPITKNGDPETIQYPLLGHVIIRKVSEFCEVTEPRRQFPESGADPKTSGCVRGSHFKTTVMAVNSKRLTDIRDGAGNYIGYTIPLWHPDDEQDNPNVYPRPHVDIRCAPADGSGEDVGCECADPSQLVFFSSTRKQDSKNPSSWPPFHGVDYLDVPPCHQPEVDAFDPNAEEGDLSDPAAVEPGFERFTLHLRPPDRLVNLAAERISPGAANGTAGGSPAVLGAKLLNITFMRAKPAVAATNEAIDKGVKAVKEVTDIFSRAGDDLQHLLDRADSLQSHLAREAERLKADDTIQDAEKYIESKLPDIKQKLRDAAQRIVPNDVVAKINNGSAAIKGILGGDIFDPKALCAEAGKQFTQAVNAYKERLKAANNAYFEAMRSQAVTRWRAVVAQTEVTVDDAKKFADEFKANADRLARELDAVYRTADALMGALGAMLEIFKGVEAAVRIQMDSRAIKTLPAATHAQIEDIRSRIVKFTSDRESELDKIDVNSVGRFIQRKLLGALPIQNLLEEGRERIRSGLRSARDTVLAANDVGFIAAVAKWVDDVNASTHAVQDFFEKTAAGDKNWTDFERIIDHVRTFIKDKIDDVPKKLLDGFVKATDTARSNFESGLASAKAAGENQIVDTLEKARQQVDALIEQLTSAIDPGTLFDGDLGLCKILERIARTLNDAVTREATQLTGLLKDAVQQALAGPIGDASRELSKLRDRLHAVDSHIRERVSELAHQALGATGELTSAIHHAADPVLRTLRALGDAPIVQGLDFNRKKVAYLLDEARKAVSTTPLAAMPARVAGAVRDLIPQRLRVPAREMLDKVLPDELKNFDLSKLVPSFAGMELGKLLSGIKMPAEARDNVKVTHGFDRQAMRAWVKTETLFKLEGEQTLFNLASIKVALRTAVFQSSMDVSADRSGAIRRTIRGTIRADWAVTIGSMEIVTFRQTTLTFQDGKVDFDISADKVQLAQVLKFLSDLMDKIGYSGNGFSLGLIKSGAIPVGVRALLSLPLPDMGGGTTAVMNLVLRAGFELRALGDNLRPDFAIGVFLGLSSREAPFAITFFILGGSGFIEIGARYAPTRGSFAVYVHLSIYACAMLAVAFGPIKGSVFIGVGVGADIDAETGRPASLSVGADLLMRGAVDVCGIITAEITLLLSIRYERDGSGSRLIGRGTLKIRIKICWCFTLKVSVGVSFGFKTSGGGGGQAPGQGAAAPRAFPFARSALAAAAEGVALGLGGILLDPPTTQPARAPDFYPNRVRQYLELFDA